MTEHGSKHAAGNDDPAGERGTRDGRSHMPDCPDIIVQALAVPAWVRSWAKRSGRIVHLLPEGAVTVAAITGDTVVFPGAHAIPESGRRVVIALRGLPDDRAVLSEAVDVAVHLDGFLRVLHGVPLSFGEHSVGMADALGHGRTLLSEVSGSGRATRDRNAGEHRVGSGVAT